MANVRGIKNRNISNTETISDRYLCLTVNEPANNDTYTIHQAIDEALILKSFQTCANTSVGGTTLNIDVLVNGVSRLTAPVSYVTKQGVVIAGILGSNVTVNIGDIISFKFTRVGAGAFGQISATLTVRPKLGQETRL